MKEMWRLNFLELPSSSKKMSANHWHYQGPDSMASILQAFIKSFEGSVSERGAAAIRTNTVDLESLLFCAYSFHPILPES